ncbi:MAG: putative ATP-dependent zinc protease [Polyangia bacterium]
MSERSTTRNAALLVPAGESGELPLARDVTAHVVRGERPGPVVWAWAPRGESDPSMAQALGELRDRLSPRYMAGAVGLLLQGPPPPFAGEAYRWSDAIRTVTEGADALVLLAGPPSPLVAAPHAELDIGDAAARKIARALGARFALPAHLPLERRIVVTAPVWWIDGEQERLSRAVIDRAAAALGSLLGTLGITDDPPLHPDVRVIVKKLATVETSGGVLEAVAHPGDIVERGQPIAYEGPPGARERRTVRAPASGVLVSLPAAQSPGAGVITVGKLSRTLPKLRAPKPSPEIFDIGWCEHVALPELGVKLRAKVDTGARSCALHVTSLREIGFDDGGNVLCDVTIPDERGIERALRVVVVEYAHVKDSGGHTERRPVIETLLRMGDRGWRVRVTLTDRGDMRFPMLVGRTALLPDMRVHPNRRWLSGR